LCSVSGDPDLRPNVVEMGCWLERQLNKYDVETMQVDLNPSPPPKPQLPPLILGKIGTDKSKKTVLVYGHYDVQPVNDFSILCQTRCYEQFLVLT
jgi:Cys-Gly metallodipeptidase DUG1